MRGIRTRPGALSRASTAIATIALPPAPRPPEPARDGRQCSSRRPQRRRRAVRVRGAPSRGASCAATSTPSHIGYSIPARGCSPATPRSYNPRGTEPDSQLAGLLGRVVSVMHRARQWQLAGATRTRSGRIARDNGVHDLRPPVLRLLRDCHHWTENNRVPDDAFLWNDV